MVRPHDSRIYPSIEIPADDGIAPDLFPIENAIITDKRQRPTKIHHPKRDEEPRHIKTPLSLFDDDVEGV